MLLTYLKTSFLLGSEVIVILIKSHNFLILRIPVGGFGIYSRSKVDFSKNGDLLHICLLKIICKESQNGQYVHFNQMRQLCSKVLCKSFTNSRGKKECSGGAKNLKTVAVTNSLY